MHPLNVLIIPDKFKGTLSASAAAEAIARGWRQVMPGDTLKLLPMSDGGDGFGEVMGTLLRARARLAKTVDAAHRPCKAHWWYQPVRRTALVDSSGAIGLAMLPPGRFHPFDLDTWGLGILMCQAAARGAKRCLVGIGGSATNDGGFGMARALGWEFFDRSGNVIERWTKLDSLKRIRPPRRKRLFHDVAVAVDVENRLLGSKGATRVYGPQKGLRPRDFERAERCLKQLAKVVKHELGLDFERLRGAGAAGGLGFGLAAFLRGRLVPGFDLFAAQAGVEAHLRSVALVITGEGALDRSSLMGKGVGEIARRCRQLRIPCVGLAGSVSTEAAKSKAFTSTYALSDLTNLETAKSDAASWLELIAATAARSFGASKTG